MYKHNNHKVIRDTILLCIATMFFIGGPIWVANWQLRINEQYHSPIKMVKNIQLHSGVHAIKYLASYGFNLKLIRKNKATVPAIYFASLPRELTKIKDTKIKKELFFSSMLAPILKVNNTIRKDRRRLKKIILNITLGTNVTEMEYYWLTQKLVQYKIKVKDVKDFTARTGDILSKLLNRMNIIPPELALAQAAQESGWGTSRFAQQGNALYGQWTWGGGCGMVPAQRDEGKKHRIKCFKNIIEAVDSYILNLNTNTAYSSLRIERQAFRDDQVMDVIPLVETLIHYSEEGQEYVEKIKNIIRVNKLKDFSRARLEIEAENEWY